MYQLSETSSNILLANAKKYSDKKKVYSITEEAAVHIDNTMVSKLYDSALDKKHVNFGTIPNSKGNITKFEGYTSMAETISCIKSLNGNKTFPELEIVEKALDNIRGLAPQFELGFKLRKEFVILTYNTMVMTCVFATSSIISAYVNYVKNPAANTPVIDMSKDKPDKSAIDNLNSFNTTCARGDMQRILRSINSNAKESFVGASAIAIPTAIIVGLVAFVPVMRTLIHYFYYTRMQVSDYLKLQAQFLEFNKTAVEANNEFNDTKKKSILKKQQKQADTLMKLSDKLKVESAEASKKANKDIEEENKGYTLGTLLPSEKSEEPEEEYDDTNDLVDVYDIL